ncbi:MAG: DUF4333 domain-containing protein [Solirubrobacterales bacterium]
MYSLRKPLILTMFVVSAAFFAGCEFSCSVGENNVDAGQAEGTISAQYEDQTGLALNEINCQSGNAEVDAEFDCTAENEAGVSLEITSTITSIDEENDRVRFNWDVTKATSDGTAYANGAVAELKRQGYAVASIECPEILIEKGTNVVCDATMADGSEQTADLTLTDADGGFDVVTSGPQSSTIN